MAPKVVLWDFEGTLAARPGIWTRCLVEVLDELVPGHGVTRDDVAPGCATGFPGTTGAGPTPSWRTRTRGGPR